MNKKHQAPTQKQAVLILSETKDLWSLFWLPSLRPEMFRFAQHDSMELARGAMRQDLWMLEFGGW
jgi:hypothetical protein